MIVVNILKKRALIIILITLLVCVVIGLFGVSLSQQVINFEKQWQIYDSQNTAASHALGNIKDNIGYGGFIHNFKNYMLRKDPLLAEKIKTDLRETYTSIENYPLDDTHTEVQEAIETVRRVVDEYASKFELAQKLVKEGVTSDVIDQQVRIDDRPAIEALQFLNQHTLQHSREQVRKTDKALEKTLSLLAWGVLIIPFIVAVAAVLIWFIRYNQRITQQLNDYNEYMSALFDAAPDAILIIDQQGNIQDANAIAMNLLGYSKQQLLAMCVEDLMPARFREGHVHNRNHSFEKPKHRTLNNKNEFYALRQDGTEVTVDISLSYMRQDERMLAIVLLRDISQSKTIENNLKQSESMLKKAQEITHVGSWEWDVETGRLNWSDEVFNIFGIDKEKFGASYERFVHYIHPDDREKVVYAINASIADDEDYNIEHRIVRTDGEIRYVQERGDVIRNGNGKAVQMIGTIFDITDQKLAERELKLADNVFNQTTEAIVITDADKYILRVNKSFSKITGYSVEEAIGKKPEQILSSGKHDKEFYKKLWGQLERELAWEGELIDRRKNGEEFTSWHTISAIVDENGNVIQYTSIFSDISEKKLAEERMQYLAEYDQLTKLPNRILFIDRLKQAMARAQRSQSSLALMFIDLDGFKAVNDNYGHHVGDKLLQEVARRLTTTIRAQDTVARLGGDEFTIILESLAHEEDAALVSNKILKNLTYKIQVDEHQLVIGCSIGISLFPVDGINSDLLIKRADIAMYHAKNNGKNQYVYYSPEIEVDDN